MRPWWNRPRGVALLTAAVLVLLHALWLGPVLRGDAALYLRDLLTFVLPYKLEAGRALAAGHFPILSQALLGGMPLWAHPSAEVADPTTLLFALVDNPHAALGWATLVHGVAAGMGAFALARALSVPPWLAAWAALAYAGSGPVLSLWCIKAVPPVALPCVAWGGVALARSAGFWPVAGTAAAVGFLMLHPDPPSVASAAFMAAVLLAARAPVDRVVQRLALLVAAGGTGVLLSGAFLGPALEVMQESPRWGLGEWSAATSPAWRWLEVLAPGGLGVPGALGALAGPLRFVDRSVLFAGSWYVGGTVLAGLACAALRRGSRRDGALAGLLALFLVLAQGDAIPGVGALWSLVHARLPEKLLLPAVLSAVMLAARGLTARDGRRAVLAVAGVAAAVLAGAGPLAEFTVSRVAPPGRELAPEVDLFRTQALLGASLLLLAALAVWRLRGRQWAPVLVMLSAAEGSVSAGTTLLTAPAEQLLLSSTVGEGQVAPGSAVMCCHPERVQHVLPIETAPELPPSVAAVEVAQRWGGNSAIVFGLRVPVGVDTGGFDPAAYRQVLLQGLPRLAAPENQAEHRALRVLAAWGVEYLVAPQAFPDPVVAALVSVVHAPQRPVYRHRLQLPAPRLRVAGQWTVTPELDAALAALAAGQVVLEQEPGVALGGPPHLGDPVVQDVAVDAEVVGGGLLLQASTLRPGWSAFLDGQSVPLLRANLLHMAVAVPPGVHRVQLRYQVPGALPGALASTLGVLLLGAWGGWRRGGGSGRAALRGRRKQAA